MTGGLISYFLCISNLSPYIWWFKSRWHPSHRKPIYIFQPIPYSYYSKKKRKGKAQPIRRRHGGVSAGGRSGGARVPMAVAAARDLPPTFHPNPSPLPSSMEPRLRQLRRVPLLDFVARIADLHADQASPVRKLVAESVSLSPLGLGPPNFILPS